MPRWDAERGVAKVGCRKGRYQAGLVDTALALIAAGGLAAERDGLAAMVGYGLGSGSGWGEGLG